MNLPNDHAELLTKVQALKQRILHDIADCSSKLNALKQELDDAEGFLRTYGSITSSVERPQRLNANSDAPSKERPRTKQQRVVEAAMALLRLDGLVLTTEQILNRLAEQDIRIGGTNELANLSAMLSRANGLKHSRAAGGWLLKSPQI